MQTVNARLRGPRIVHQDTRLNGVVEGDLTVPPGVRLELNGTVKGNLLACAGSQTVITGVVLGRLFNEGGLVEIFGLVAALRKADAERSYVHPTAQIPYPLAH